MQGKGASPSTIVVALAHVVCKPSVFAASLIPNRETPSVVAKKFRQRIQRVFSAEIFAYHLQTSYSALHRIMLVNYRKTYHSSYDLLLNIYNLSISFFPAPLPLYFALTVLNLYLTINSTALTLAALSI